MTLPKGAATAAALWAVHTHAHGIAHFSPILALTSPEKRCGKTTTLSLLRRLCRRPLPASNISSAALFRTTELHAPTLLIDEADTFLKQNEELRGILNSGHAPDQAYIIRLVGDDHEPRRFRTWAPKAIALIGKLPATLADRSIVIQLRRKLPDENIVRLRDADSARIEALTRMMARWVQDNLASLKGARPEAPKELHDRAADNWDPLLAIAEVAGGDWLAQAKVAALGLVDSDQDNEVHGVQMLRDIRGLFEAQGRDRFHTDELLPLLVALEGRRWAEWPRGKFLTANSLAKLLNPYGIKSRQLRIGSCNRHGYTLAACQDAFDRYLSP